MKRKDLRKFGELTKVKDNQSSSNNKDETKRQNQPRRILERNRTKEKLGWKKLQSLEGQTVLGTFLELFGNQIELFH